jgi:hypothetical protein
MTPPFVFMTGFADLKAYDAYDRGADAFIIKPLQPNELSQLFNKVLSGAEKWSKSHHDADFVEIGCHIENLPSNSQLQIGRSGFFISYSLAPSLQGLKKDSLIRFNFTTETELIKTFKGQGTVIWARGSAEDDLLEGCGIAINFLDKECREDVIKFITLLNSIKTIPKGALLHSEISV